MFAIADRISPFDRRSTADQVVDALDLSGRTAIVTGANAGIGFETARALASRGTTTILACRDPGRGEDAVDRIRRQHPKAEAELGILDLASLDSVRSFASSLCVEKLDCLVCNAGCFGGGYRETVDGFERTVGVCHIGHFLLVRLLLDRLERASAARVVVVSSEAHRYPARLNFNRLPLSRTAYSDVTAYGQAKLCNILFAKELHRRCADRGVTAYALHPGALVPTELGRDSVLATTVFRLARPFTKSVAQGAATSVFCATYPGLERHGGEYFRNCQLRTSSPETNRPAVARKLWQLSEVWTGMAL